MRIYYAVMSDGLRPTLVDSKHASPAMIALIEVILCNPPHCDSLAWPPHGRTLSAHGPGMQIRRQLRDSIGTHSFLSALQLNQKGDQPSRNLALSARLSLRIKS